MLSLLVAAAVASTVACAPAPPGPASEPIPGATAAVQPVAPGGAAPQALAAAQAYSDAKGGLALLVWRKGRIIYERYAPGCSADTLFDTYSMAKSVLGLAYGAALQDRVIDSIDQPVSDYLTEWRGDPRGAIPLRALLGMSSGLKLYSLARKEPQALALLTGDDVVATALATPRAADPGAYFEYANVNSELAGIALGRALRRAGRGDYARFLSEALWAPLGQQTAQLSLDHPGGEPRYFAGLKASARDWMRLGALIAGQGRHGDRQVLPAAWIRAITTPSPRNPNYGLQTWIGSPYAPHRSYGPNTPLTATASAPYAAPDMVFFDGAGGQRVYVSPGLDLVVVRIGVQDWTYDDAIVPNAVIAGLR